MKLNRRSLIKGAIASIVTALGKYVQVRSLPISRQLQLGEVYMPQLRYHAVDNSLGTNIRLSFNREKMAEGVLLHTTLGRNSLGYLQGGVLLDGRIAGADYLIDRNGTRHLLTLPTRVAYHAGISRLLYNDILYRDDQISQLLLGIELECAENEYCTYQQIDSAAELVVLAGIARGWRFPYVIYGHYEVAVPLGRRSDPHGFAWGGFFGRLYYYALEYNVAGLDT